MGFVAIVVALEGLSADKLTLKISASQSVSIANL